MDYFYPPFWLLLFLLVAAAVTVIHYRKLRFIDIQIWIFVTVLGFAADMLLCKQYDLYYFVSEGYQGWYSFWACLFMNPPIGLVYIKLLPARKSNILPYTGLWIAGLLALEIFVGVPQRIVNYPRWQIFPWSIVVYVLSFTAVYYYYRWLGKNIAEHGKA